MFRNQCERTDMGTGGAAAGPEADLAAALAWACCRV